TVDAHIMNLRKKLMCNQNGEEYIQTVYGIGYKFASDARHV
ncbi:MAG: response regulator transcription factor, partial [Caldilineaceae bacterium]|nr:response regulator transcription factor [Caldilineaceae bacterium]